MRALPLWQRGPEPITKGLCKGMPHKAAFNLSKAITKIYHKKDKKEKKKTAEAGHKSRILIHRLHGFRKEFPAKIRDPPA
jgi:hypothetical protein